MVIKSPLEILQNDESAKNNGYTVVYLNLPESQKENIRYSILQEMSSELENKLSSDDTFVLYIGRPDCGDCKEFHPILTSYLEENKGTYLYYLNIQAFRDAAMQEGASEKEIDFYKNIREELDFNWTPILKLVNKGETISEYTYLSEEYYEIKDDTKKAQAKEKFVEDFKTWMANIYE